MKRKQLSLAIHGVLAVSLLATMPVMAQDAAAADAGGQKTTTLESIKVTARKREETLQEVPVAVTAFTADTLDKLNVRDLSEQDTPLAVAVEGVVRGVRSCRQASAWRRRPPRCGRR